MLRRHWVAALAIMSGAVQLWLAHRFFGFLTGDEVEVLGEAFRVATGYEYGLWDVRNALVPDIIVAPFVWLVSRFSVRDPGALVVAATVPFAAASSIAILLVHRLALRWTSDSLAAGAATVLFALHWLPLGFGSTTYPRVIAMACVVGAALLMAQPLIRPSATFSPQAGRRATNPPLPLSPLAGRGWRAAPGEGRPFLAGVLIAVAFADRYSEIVYLLPLLILAKRRAWQVAIGFAAAALLTVGVCDWIRWGAPFHSLREFAEVTLVERDFASRVAQQRPLWYLETLPRWCALTLFPLLWSARDLRRAWWLVLVPLALLSAIAHKELRYLQGIIPFVAILGGAGFAAWWRTRRVLAVALLALSIGWNLWGLRFLARESRPAVEAARFLGANGSLRTLAIGQLWACGDRLYLGDDRRVIDIGTPVHSLERLRECDAVALYESDLTPQVQAALQGFTRVRTFRAGRARDVVVFIAERSAR